MTIFKALCGYYRVHAYNIWPHQVTGSLTSKMVYILQVSQ